MRKFTKYWGVSVILIFATFLPFQAYSFQNSKKPADIDWKNIDAIEAMAIANEWKWSQKDVKSFVNTKEVVFEFADGKKKEIPLPEEEIIVAVAPYIQSTHQSTIHYMSSCQGELANRAFYVKAVDHDGNLLVNENITTLRNGFFELWLPRNRIIDLSIQGLNRTARGKITTYDASKTCVTTFRLR